MDARDRLIEVAIEARHRPDHDRLPIALIDRAAQGSPVRADVDRESGQTVLGGVSEAEIRAEIVALRAVHGIDLAVGPPQVAYRETLTRRVEQSSFVRPPHPSEGQTAGVRFVFAPEPRGAGNAFVRDNPEGGVVEPRRGPADPDSTCPIATSAPDDHMPGILKGIVAVMDAGVIGGYPLVDVRVVLTGAIVDDDEPSIVAFERATRTAFCEALQRGGPILLEPVMAVEVAAPARHAEAVVRAIEGRRGLVGRRDARAGEALLTAEVPLAGMLGAALWLPALAPGARLDMRFERFAPVPDRHGGLPPPTAARVMRA